MTPYYEAAGIAIYHGDCREVSSNLPRHSMDCLVTDPPYGVGCTSTSGRTRGVRFVPIAGDDGSLDVVAALGACLSALRIHRHVYIFGRFDFSALPLASPVELIWDKGILGAGNVRAAWGPQHEVITFATYSPSRANRAAGDGRLTARLRRGSVLRCDRPNSQRVRWHPTEKPVAILRQMIESSTMPGEIVCDPFAGCGSTLVAAKMEGRRAVGVELDEHYCEIAARRLTRTTPATEAA